MRDKLDDKEVEKLWGYFRSTNDQEARDTLIVHYLHLVKYVVGKLLHRLPTHVRSDDLYSTGIIGLVRAVEKYDPTMKNKFETYAILLIRGAIIDEMRTLDWVPRSVHQKANMISKAQDELCTTLGREATDSEIAKHLHITMEEYENLLDRVKPAVMLPLDLEVDQQGETASIAEKIEDQKAMTSYEHLDQKEFRRFLEEAVTNLPEQEKTVLVLYYFENMMLKDIGKFLGVSESRISQIHSKALLRLRGRLQAQAGEFLERF